ncbi:TetR family transcriptional regulator [Salana multivorans]|uniref:TetR family transcriptional regulator n=1 Tax=Salana multivorans TaxID=120377 RepID=A0A3N2DBZ8_9MICO|nr:TetR family transcriptional regulator C-terminal domain-containing protein [Salana multivorans]ROR97257.1 TetR family transcriptional regulator [Salana multivorans]
MPRLIDVDARNAEIAAASLRVLERDGLAGLSVRRVAEEAGIATASLRRAFPTQHALREHCLALVEERATARIRALPPDLTGRRLVEAMLAQLLPLDRERRTELAAQIQLGVLALTDPALRAAAVRLDTAVGRACRAAVAILADAGQLGRDRDPDYEAQRLHALLDGAAVHGLWAGEATQAVHALDLVSRHLAELADEESG